jgi:hypothetical protein
MRKRDFLEYLTLWASLSPYLAMPRLLWLLSSPETPSALTEWFIANQVKGFDCSFRFVSEVPFPLFFLTFTSTSGYVLAFSA